MVQSKVYDKFCEMLAEAAKNIKVADGLRVEPAGATD